MHVEDEFTLVKYERKTQRKTTTSHVVPEVPLHFCLSCVLLLLATGAAAATAAAAAAPAERIMLQYYCVSAASSAGKTT